MQSADPLVAILQKWVEVFMRRSMRNFIAYSREMGLSMSQLGSIFHIFRGRSSVTDIGEFLGVSSAASSQLLDQLVRQGLILRTEDPHDRRFKQIVLTDQGRKVIQESVAARMVWMEELAQTLSEDEREQVTIALNILIDKSIQLERQTEPV
jgi:DNA-binding MarR family transcriptional regulator